MGYISRDSFKRLVLLYILGEFEHGSYGHTRLQKIAYFIQRELDVKPFTFVNAYYGQYSAGLDAIKDQLISMGRVHVSPLDSGLGNIYESTVKSRRSYYAYLLLNTYGGMLLRQIHQVVEEWGYRSEEEILAKAYELDDLEAMEDFEMVEESNLPERIQIKGVEDDDCDELELALDPNFVEGMRRIAEGLEKSALDIDKVKKVGFPLQTSSS